MKTTIAKFIPIAVVAIIAGAISITTPSCKKEECYQCELHAANGGVSQREVCGEDDRNQLTSQGWTCKDDGRRQ